MAIKDPCEHCGQVLSVPEDMRGKKVRCPACGNRSLVLTAEDRRVMEDERRHKAQEEKDRNRLELLERIETASNARIATETEVDPDDGAGAATAPVPATAVAQRSSGAEPEGEKLRDLADLLGFASYAIPLLALATGLLPLVVGGDLGLRLAFLGVCITLGLAGFSLFQWLAELSRHLDARDDHDQPPF